MIRILSALFATLALLALPGCLAVKTVDVVTDVGGAVIGATGEVVEGAVDVVTPDGDDEEDDSKED